MTIDEWKQKLIKKGQPHYTHFDRRTSLDKCWSYIDSPNKVCHHAFYPFIHYTIVSRKIQNAKKADPKKREIYYAAHLDSWIYRYYAYKINEAYNLRVHNDGISNVAVAYRTDLGKSNIQFAKEAFDHIRQMCSCYVMIGDFTDFFDSLDHNYLKQQLCKMLSVASLPNDYYAVFKSVSKFAYAELSDLLLLNGLENNRKGQKEFNQLSRERALSPEEFRKHRSIVKRNPHPDRGVPQGSPISAVLANVYMIDTDKMLFDYVSTLNGFYMRYSDDFIIVLPKTGSAFSEQYRSIKRILDAAPNLVLKDTKTMLFSVDGKEVRNCTAQFLPEGKSGKDIIDFLGFSFDGQRVTIRDKTISKYYNRLYRKANTIVKNHGVSPKGKTISAKNLYQKYSYKGSRSYQIRAAKKKGLDISKQEIKGNFLDYVLRAKKEFQGEPVDLATKNHMAKIRKRLNKAEP